MEYVWATVISFGFVIGVNLVIYEVQRLRRRRWWRQFLRDQEEAALAELERHARVMRAKRQAREVS